MWSNLLKVSLFLWKQNIFKSVRRLSEALDEKFQVQLTFFLSKA